jgi:hypothetical protein
MAHWRDHLDSPLMGAYSLFDDATEKFKTIDGYIVRCADEMHLLGASGKRKCLVAYTSIDKKPMKINVTIANQIALGAKSQNPAKWVNVPVTFFVDERVSTKDGIVAALRVRAREEKAPDYTAQIAELRACTTVEQLVSVWGKVGNQAIVAVKDEMKTKLTPKKEYVQANTTT